jgi:signal transduction histidine kinase
VFRRLKPYQLVVDVSVAVVYFLAVVPFELATTPGMPMPLAASLGAVAVSLGFSSTLAVRRLSPGLALALAWASALAQMALLRGPGFVDVAIFAVLYATAAYGSTRVFWAGFSSALVGAVVITAYLYLGPLYGGTVDLSLIPTAIVVLVAASFALLLSWTVGALARTALRARENRAAQRRAEAEAMAEQERVRIARDMHDVVAHSLAVVIAQADGARYAAAADASVATAALGTISATARAALADVRLLLTQLRHSQTDGPQPTLADLEALYAQVRAAGVDLRVTVDPVPPGEAPAGVQLAVYRILQEALTNALRHGDGGAVDVRLAWHPDRVDLEVRNGVAPADRVDAAPGAGHGLIGMRERAQLAGGRLHAGADDRAFIVTGTLPIGAAA